MRGGFHMRNLLYCDDDDVLHFVTVFGVIMEQTGTTKIDVFCDISRAVMRNTIE